MNLYPSCQHNNCNNIVTEKNRKTKEYKKYCSSICRYSDKSLYGKIKQNKSIIDDLTKQLEKNKSPNFNGFGTNSSDAFNVISFGVRHSVVRIVL
jgi:hypothetical protein